MENEKKRQQPFHFRGTELNYWTLKSFPTLKTYLDDTHDKRSLVQDENGTLYLYIFQERILFFFPDKIDEFFFVVENEKEADEQSNKSIHFLISNLPHIYISSDYQVFTEEKNPNKNNFSE